MLDLEKRIKKYMSDYRFNHTLSVAKECEKLASLFGIDGKKLIIAAYLHDITKEMSIDEQLKLCEKEGIILDFDTLNSPKTMHSFTSPLLIKKDFPEYNDSVIINAVRYHTTGRANMTLHEKLLYLADYIEPTRRFEECKKLRNYFYSNTDDIYANLDKAIILSLKHTISELTDMGAYIHIETVNAYNFLISSNGDL